MSKGSTGACRMDRGWRTLKELLVDRRSEESGVADVERLAKGGGSAPIARESWERTIITTLTSALKTIAAASGSHNYERESARVLPFAAHNSQLNSAVGPRFPLPSAPPIRTIWDTLSRTSSGNIAQKRAAFVRVPVATMVRRPLSPSPPGIARDASAIARTALWPSDSASLSCTKSLLPS